MREYIFFAEDPDIVWNWIGNVQADVVDLLLSLGLEVKVERAVDPFFDTMDLRQKFQKDKNLKSEIISNGLAVGSLNLHLQAMTRNCRITGPSGKPLFSGCFGLGYDRIAGLLNRANDSL